MALISSSNAWASCGVAKYPSCCPQCRQQPAMRRMTCLTLRSGPRTTSPFSSRSRFPWSSIWGTPAFRKYLLTTISVATCDQLTGTSAPCISNTTDPSGFAMRLVRFSYVTSSNGSLPGVVKTRGILSPPLCNGGAEERRPGGSICTVIPSGGSWSALMRDADEDDTIATYATRIADGKEENARGDASCQRRPGRAKQFLYFLHNLP